MAPQHLVVVPHTHWDREWYRTHEAFRYRLVRLLDGLLDLLERDPDFRHFTLDGQAIALDDYLELRPEARERVAKLVHEGRLLIGPWYVLPDEWLVSGEALLRNLSLGLSRAAAFGGGMRLGYVPDQFGHVGQLPQIFRGFGFDAAMLWRGVGAEVEETAFDWEAPDGTTLFTVYLLRGYGNAALLPLESGALAERLKAAAGALASHSRGHSLLLMNGSDHLEPQAGLPAALTRAAERLGDTTLEIGTLPGYVARARAEATGALPRHRGELRSGLRAPLLEGCASSRMPQKRSDFLNDRTLTRYAEPLSAWLEALGGDGDPAYLARVWEIALQNHPHDSICGCSIDAVHDQMETRFARVAEMAGAHLQRVTRDLGRRVALSASGDGPGIVAWNPHAAGVTTVEGMLDVDSVAGARGLHVRDESERKIPVHAEIVTDECVLADYTLPASVCANLLRGFPAEFMGLVPCALERRSLDGAPMLEIQLAAEPPVDFDFDAARRREADALEREGDAPIRYRARRLPSVRLRFVDALPGHGLRVYRLAQGRAATPAGLGSERRPDGGVAIWNEAWRIEVSPDGSVRATQRRSGAVVEDALRIVSEADRGDTYTFDPVPDAPVIDRPERVRVRLLPEGGAEVALRIDARYRIPAALESDRARRTRRALPLPVRTTLRLHAGLDRVDVEFELEHAARDHRLRAHVRAPFAARALEVESAFEVAERPIAPARDAFGSDRPAELPTGACPQRSFATLRGDRLALTVANRGAAEVEALVESDTTASLAVTLLRAVGWLSRDDLVQRPGHAGPPLETPGAQVPGAHRVELSWRLHPDGEATRDLEAQRFAVPALLFPGGVSGGELVDGARLLEVDDPRVAVSAVEPRPGGESRVRLWNPSSGPRDVGVRWTGSAGRRLEPEDLAGSPLDPDHATVQSDGSVRLSLRPWQLIALRLR